MLACYHHVLLCFLQFPHNLTDNQTALSSIVIAFQLPLSNSNVVEDLKKVVMAESSGKRVQVILKG